MPDACAVHVAPAAPVAPAGSAKLGASFTGVIVMVRVFVVLSTPPLAVPPLSWAMTVTVALPLAFAAGVKVSVPPALRVGWLLKSAVLLLFTTRLVMLWLDSLAGPVVKVASEPL